MIHLTQIEEATSLCGVGEGKYITVFSSKITWDYLRPSGQPVTWDKIVWFKESVPKHAFMFWTAHLDRLPVRARLVNWGMDTPVSCCLCNLLPETRDHLLLHCEYSAHIWYWLLQKLGQHCCLFVNWSVFISWLSSRSPNLRTPLKRIASQAAIYTIWKERNNCLHNSTSMPPEQLYSQLDPTIRDILLARRGRKNCRNLLSNWFTHI